MHTAHPTPSSPSPADPAILPTVQVDRGAIKFLLQGADVMCPGLTSAGGQISATLAKGSVVVPPPAGAL